MAEAKRLLVVEDDTALRESLVDSFVRRDWEVRSCPAAEQVEQTLGRFHPGYAVVDLKLPGQSGLEVVQRLAQLDPAPSTVVLTGFAAIATAIEAIKLGAAHYLAKPATAKEIIAAFDRQSGQTDVPVVSRPSSLKTVEWELIHAVLIEVDFNISEAARRLGMHRRTLARKLEKRQIR